jgi:hypothetical protein
VCAGWRRQHQQEHNQEPNRNSSRICDPIHHSRKTDETPRA